jgi:hypothetical protein
VKFSKAAKDLGEIIEATADPRLASVNVTDAGYLHVTFVEGSRADFRHEFDLDAAEKVLKAR